MIMVSYAGEQVYGLDGQVFAELPNPAAMSVNAFLITHAINPFSDLSDVESLSSSLSVVYTYLFQADTLITSVSINPTGTDIVFYMIFSGAGTTIFIPTRASNLVPVGINVPVNFAWGSGFGIFIPAQTQVTLVAAQTTGSGGTIQCGIIGYSSSSG